MTELEIYTEKLHRTETRLAILFGDGPVTISGQWLAEQEAEEWERLWRDQEQSTRTP